MPTQQALQLRPLTTVINLCYGVPDLQVPHAGGAGLIHADDDREDCVEQCTTHRVLVPCAVLCDDLVDKAASAGQQHGTW